MSDNASESEQQQQMEKIFICADVWHGIFAFLSPFDVGLKMALISDRLDVLVDVHFKSRKWLLRWLHIRRATDGNGAEMVNLSGERQPIPEGPLPNNVIGLKKIVIGYIDQTVIEFLQRIRRLFDPSGATIFIDTYDGQSRSWKIICQKIWPLISGTVSPPEDGRPKMLHCDYYSVGMGGGLKGSFVDTSGPASSYISRGVHSGIEPFELTNNLTRERLTMRRLDQGLWLLVRCPIGRDEDKWAKWETEAIQWAWNKGNCIIVNFQDKDIGEGMDEAKAGPSECKK
uniref:Uncharacterized protein n=1 Tax=Globodera rostochiensis TaxID=31243 RepID=A0A914GPE0_GLORO